MELYGVKFENKWLQLNYLWSDKLTLYCLFTNKNLATDMLIDVGKGEVVSLMVEERRKPKTKQIK